MTCCFGPALTPRCSQGLLIIWRLLFVLSISRFRPSTQVTHWWGAYCYPRTYREVFCMAFGKNTGVLIDGFICTNGFFACISVHVPVRLLYRSSNGEPPTPLHLFQEFCHATWGVAYTILVADFLQKAAEGLLGVVPNRVMLIACNTCPSACRCANLGLHPSSPSSPSSHCRLQWTHMDSMSSALHPLDTRLLHAATVTRQRSLCIALYVHDGALDYCICASWQEVLWSKRTWNHCLNHGIQACWHWSCLLTSFH